LPRRKTVGRGARAAQQQVAAHLRGDGAKRGMVVPASRFRRGVLALADEVVERDRNARLGANMITLEDCVGLCGLTEEEVLAIAEHEHLSEIAATALAAYLLSQEHGGEKVLDMIVDDIRQAQLVKGNKEHVLALLHVLHHFLKTHPEARPSQHPWSKRF
jgi:hypothetical protein